MDNLEDLDTQVSVDSSEVINNEGADLFESCIPHIFTITRPNKVIIINALLKNDKKVEFTFEILNKEDN